MVGGIGEVGGRDREKRSEGHLWSEYKTTTTIITLIIINHF